MNESLRSAHISSDSGPLEPRDDGRDTASLRLCDLHPEWTAFAPGRTGTALLCDCPCGCGRSLVVPLLNPLDGGPPDEHWQLSARWLRVGVTFEALTIVGLIRILEVNDQGETHTHWKGFIAQGRASRR